MLTITANVQPTSGADNISANMATIKELVKYINKLEEGLSKANSKIDELELRLNNLNIEAKSSSTIKK